MPRATLGAILGLSIGIADVLLMLPLSFPDKRTALLAAFCSRRRVIRNVHGEWPSRMGGPTPGRPGRASGVPSLEAMTWISL
jgi:hypothetical protein